MSMLAERRQKTKYIIQPVKKPLWKTDEGTKFGKQLMEKMGWTAGKGLGINEQGISEPIRVGYKNDTKGMGFKENDDDWIDNQQEFDLLLSSLANGTADKESLKRMETESLEEKSKKSKARVHYQKFTRGKDLARYSEDDLACILGSKKRRKKKKENPEENNLEKSSEKENSFGVTTVNGGSLTDYFKRKWKNMEKNTQETPCSEGSEPSFEESKAESRKKRKNNFEEGETTEPSQIQVETGRTEDDLSRFDEGEKNIKKRKARNGESENEVNKKEFKKKKYKRRDEAETIDIKIESADSEPKAKRKRKKRVSLDISMEEENPCKAESKISNDFVADSTFSKNINKIGKRKKVKTSESDKLQNPEETNLTTENEKKEKEILNDKSSSIFRFSGEKIKRTKKFSRSKILNLVCEVRLDKFKGSNLEAVSGYGAPKPKR